MVSAVDKANIAVPASHFLGTDVGRNKLIHEKTFVANMLKEIPGIRNFIDPRELEIASKYDKVVMNITKDLSISESDLGSALGQAMKLYAISGVVAEAGASEVVKNVAITPQAQKLANQVISSTIVAMDSYDVEYRDKDAPASEKLEYFAKEFAEDMAMSFGAEVAGKIAKGLSGKLKQMIGKVDEVPVNGTVKNVVNETVEMTGRTGINPLDDPKIAKDIVADPDAVCGYAPKK